MIENVGNLKGILMNFEEHFHQNSIRSKNFLLPKMTPIKFFVVREMDSSILLEFAGLSPNANDKNVLIPIKFYHLRSLDDSD